MMEENKHRVVLTGRSSLAISDVQEVISFNEEALELLSGMGRIQITGMNLHVEKISVEEGDILITGRISSLYYPEEAREKKGFFSRLMN